MAIHPSTVSVQCVPISLYIVVPPIVLLLVSLMKSPRGTSRTGNLHDTGYDIAYRSLKTQCRCSVHLVTVDDVQVRTHKYAYRTETDDDRGDKW